MLWDKQPEETDTAYHWFCKYRDVGLKRSHVGIAQKYGKKPSYICQLARWSKRYGWMERVSAYDLYMEGRQRDAMEDERIVAAREHISVANEFLSKAMAKLKLLEVEDLSNYDMRTMAEFAIKTKREALGVASELKIISDVSVTDKTTDRMSKEFMEIADRLLAMRDGNDNPS